MSRKKGHRKSSRKKDLTLEKIVFATAILNLIDAIIEIIKELH